MKNFHEMEKEDLIKMLENIACNAVDCEDAGDFVLEVCETLEVENGNQGSLATSSTKTDYP